MRPANNFLPKKMPAPANMMGRAQSQAAPADLVIKSADARYVWQNQPSGDPKLYVSLTVVVANKGGVDSGNYGVWFDQKKEDGTVFLSLGSLSSGDMTADGQNIHVGSSYYGFVSLAPGEERTYTRLIGQYQYKVPANGSRPYSYFLIINQDHTVVESNYENNSVFVPITPPLPLT